MSRICREGTGVHVRQCAYHASQKVATSIICVRPWMCVDTLLRCTLSSTQANNNSARRENARYVGVCFASRPARPVAGDSRPVPSHHAGGPGTGCVLPFRKERLLEEPAEPARDDTEPEPGRGAVAERPDALLRGSSSSRWALSNWRDRATTRATRAGST